MSTILAQLNHIALKFLETMEIQDLQQVIVDEGVKIVDAKFGSIYLSEKRKLNRVYTTLPIELQVTIRKKGFTYKAFKQRKVMVIPVEQVTPVHITVKVFEVRSIVLVPLCYKQRCIGVISFDSNKSSFSEQKMNLLRLYGALATLALKQANLYADKQKSIELRDLFISLTAHEFRTPLTTIHGYAQLLKRKLKNENNAMLLEWATELNAEVFRLIEMTSELLQISRIKSGKIDYSFEECRLSEIITTAVTRFRFSFPNYRIEVHGTYVNEDAIIGDSDKLLQVFTNILENAGKFSPPDKPVSITLKVSGKWLVTSIQDCGRGIAKADLEKIFLGFYKGVNSDEKQGMGLGLFISNNIVDAHQGKLKVSSQLNRGTTFSILLPRQE